MPTVEWNGKPYEHVPNGNLLAPASLDMERTLLGPRTDLALAYARENGVNRIEGADRAWLGIACAGKPYYDLMQALRGLGLDGPGLERAGIRILKLGMLWPVEPEIAREFAHGLDEIVVVEEKGPFLETHLKEALYGTAGAPRILGKRTSTAGRCCRASCDLDADLIARAVAARLEARGVRIDSVDARLRKLAEIHGRRAELPMAQRTPFFCSGCPHNSSVQAPDGTLVGAGIGCHTMVLLNPEGKGEITGITQMGGEGAQWIGMAPFTEDTHLVQNLGDGTFHHSGSLAIRAAVAAGVNITYKLLYNEHVAMTGGQEIEGQLSIPDLTRWLELEGVARIIVTTEDLSDYRGVDLAEIAEVRDRKELLSAQQELAQVEGVTVLIHDQECAAELRRKRKRGKAAEPKERVWINERVCEGCGDCGHKSSCLSRDPGRDRVRPQDADPPGLLQQGLLVPRGRLPLLPHRRPRREGEALDSGARRRAPRAAPARGRRRLRRADDGHRRHRRRDRQPGARHGGADRRPARVGPRPDRPVAEGRPGDQSDLRITRARLPPRARRPPGASTCTSASTSSARRARRTSSPPTRERTVAVVSTSAVPTGRMVIDVDERFPELAAELDKIDAATRREHNLYLDAQRLSERLFGDHMMTNTLALGAAYQRGLLPVSGEALERAIELNGAAVEKNLAALALGPCGAWPRRTRSRPPPARPRRSRRRAS